MKDLLFLAGIASTVFGVWQIYQPIAWIVAGLAVITVVVLIERDALRSRKPVGRVGEGGQDSDEGANA